jgi:hypothetical protein
MDFNWKQMDQKEMRHSMMMQEGSNWIKMSRKNNNKKKQGLRLLQNKRRNKNQKNKLLHQKLRRLK